MSQQPGCGNICQIARWYPKGNQCFDDFEKRENNGSEENGFITSTPNPDQILYGTGLLLPSIPPYCAQVFLLCIYYVYCGLGLVIQSYWYWLFRWYRNNLEIAPVQEKEPGECRKKDNMNPQELMTQRSQNKENWNNHAYILCFILTVSRSGCRYMRV